MMNQPVIEEKKYIQCLPFGHTQTIAFAYTKEVIDEIGEPASTTFHKTIEITALSEYKYCLTCIEAHFSDVRQPDPSRNLQLLVLEVFDVLVVSTDKTGALIRIHNFAYLQELWQTLRIEIIQDHDDEAYLQRISDMDVLMQHSQSVIEYLSLPSNYGLYFNGYKNFNLAEPIHTALVVLDGIFSNQLVEEKITVNVAQTAKQQLVTLQLAAFMTSEDISYTGNCIYLDGQLDVCFKEIKTKSFTINYSAKWVGLKKSFRQ